MRVVAGSVGGRRIDGPDGDHRPTMDKVRGAIFNSLASRMSLADKTVVDLFAGSGALGIEALSRGAASATFVEKARSNADLIRSNLNNLGLQGEVKAQDVMTFIGSAPVFDVAFVDPPYAFDDWNTLLAGVKAELVVCESNRAVEPGAGWEVIRQKRYSGTEVTMLERLANQAGQPQQESHESHCAVSRIF